MTEQKKETVMQKLIRDFEEGLVEIDQSAPKPTADDILDMIRKKQGVINPDHDKN